MRELPQNRLEASQIFLGLLSILIQEPEVYTALTSLYSVYPKSYAIMDATYYGHIRISKMLEKSTRSHWICKFWIPRNLVAIVGNQVLLQV